MAKKQKQQAGEWRNRIVRTGTAPASEFKANELNWRVHPKAQRDALKGVLSEVGWVTGVITNVTTGNVIDGHARIEEALKLGDETPVPFVEVELSEAEEMKILATLDPLSAMAGADKEQLDALLREVETADAAVMQMLDDLAKVNGLDYGKEGANDADAEPQMDKADELRVKWGVERGQVWQLGEHRLMCGDCTDAAVVARVMQGEKADMLTDPPYGMDLDTDWSDAVGSLGSIGAKHNTTGNKYSPVIGDDKQFDPSHLFDLFVTGEMFLFGADYYAEFLPQKNDGSWLVWDKRKESQEDAIGAEFELLWSKNKHKRRMLRHDWFGFLSSNNSKEARNRLHPTQKPTSLIEDILQQWCKAELIVDPYLGSGTTIIACENLGRRCRAVEIDPGYVAVALERWHQATGKTPALLDS